MFSAECRDELRNAWLPNITDAGLARLIELLEQASPLLLHGSFSRVAPMGCLATQAAWHHPATGDLDEEPGIIWLTRVAGLNPATSLMLQAWDDRTADRSQLRQELLLVLQAERARREATTAPRARAVSAA